MVQEGTRHLPLCNTYLIIVIIKNNVIMVAISLSLSQGARILIDPKAQLTLLGTEMDFKETKLGNEFVFYNPNVKGTCGCGESFHV